MEVAHKYRKAERIGRMNQRAQIHFATETVNSYGERVRAWAGLGTFWTNVRYNEVGREGESAGQDTVMTRVMFDIRYNSDVSELQRVYFSGRLYDIEAISVTADRQYMTLVTKQYGYDPAGAPDAQFQAGALAYTEDFTGATINTVNNSVTVTVYGGLLPANPAQIFVFYNGQHLTQWTHTGSVITMGFDVDSSDLITVTFFP